MGGEGWGGGGGGGGVGGGGGGVGCNRRTTLETDAIGELAVEADAIEEQKLKRMPLGSRGESSSELCTESYYPLLDCSRR